MIVFHEFPSKNEDSVFFKLRYFEKYIKLICRKSDENVYLCEYIRILIPYILKNYRYF